MGGGGRRARRGGWLPDSGQPSRVGGRGAVPRRSCRGDPSEWRTQTPTVQQPARRTSAPIRRERYLGGQRDGEGVAAAPRAGTAHAWAAGPVGCARRVRRPPGFARRVRPVRPSTPGRHLRPVDPVRRVHRCAVTHRGARGGRRAATPVGVPGQARPTRAGCAAGPTTYRAGGTTTHGAGGTTIHRVGGEPGVLPDGLRRSGHRGPPVRTVLIEPIAEAGAAGGFIAPLRRFRTGRVEVQVVQEAGRVGGDKVQPVLRRLPETAWCRHGRL